MSKFDKDVEDALNSWLRIREHEWKAYYLSSKDPHGRSCVMLYKGEERKEVIQIMLPYCGVIADAYRLMEEEIKNYRQKNMALIENNDR